MLPTNSNIPLPYAIEYAKSARSTCKKCKKTIAENALRMSINEPSHFFDGNIDNWYHFSCFWYKLNRSNDDINVTSIRGVDWLRWEDQEELREKIAKFKRNSSSLTPEPEENTLKLSQLRIERSATNRGKCIKCSEAFEKGEIKMWKKSKWLHAKCLFNESLKILGNLDEVPNWMDQEEPARSKVAEVLKEVLEARGEAVPKVEPKEEEAEVKSEATELEPTSSGTYHPENLDFDPLNFASRPTSSLKRENDVKVEAAVQEDAMAKKRRLGREARLAEIRKTRMKKQVDRLWEYRQVFEKLSHGEKVSILTENDQDIPEGHDPTAQVMDRLVDNALFGCPITCPECPKGKLVYHSARRTYVCTGYATEYSRCAFESKNPIRTHFKMPDRLISKYKLHDLVFNEMTERLYMDEGEEVVVRNQSSSTSSAVPAVLFAAEAFDTNNFVPITLSDAAATSNTHIIKNGTLVDAKFTYASRSHVLKNEADGTLYQATLSLTDLTQNKNSYYKIQLLKDDHQEYYYVFRSWGRVGTEVGGSKHDQCNSLAQAISQFEDLFMEKTKNQWKYRKHFRKQPGAFAYVETDFSEFEQLEQVDVIPGSKTKLPATVKSIVMSIFDVENMKSALKSFEMDINKMPLGRLSRNQINQAFNVLTELGELLAEFPINTVKVVDATSKFYTIIPHNFGMKVPEPLDSFHKIKEKNNMLNALLDIKFAYDQLYDGDNKSSRIPHGVDPVDVNYEKLKCMMTPVDPRSQDWKDIKEYMTNTQGSTHDVNWHLMDIHELNRHGEQSKFKAHLGNRMLLWHGSGKMNFAGILGQGLRIAPPEAPVSGYMFGKGVYFADMFSKSFFYCRATARDEAYLLLCDVALGSSMVLTSATTMTKQSLGKSYQSVKGMGRECPNEDGCIMHPAGYLIPKGHRKTQLSGQQGVNFSLLYNEYIVYDVDQILLRYLVRVRMNHARHR